MSSVITFRSLFFLVRLLWSIGFSFLLFSMIPSVASACQEGERRSCSGTGSQRFCTKGFQRCHKGKWETCQCIGKSLKDICDCEDNNCDGRIDEGCTCGCAGVARLCGGGPRGPTKGNCRHGVQLCKTGGGWHFCEGSIEPAKEKCDGVDNDCDGVVDEGCSCVEGKTTPCYTGPSGTQDKGPCQGGTQLCKNGKLLPCKEQILPSRESCDNKDNDCDGLVDEGAYKRCGTSVGECTIGLQACKNGKWQICRGVNPKPEVCDCKDNDCDGKIDEKGSCLAGQICELGKCIKGGPQTSKEPMTEAVREALIREKVLAREKILAREKVPERGQETKGILEKHPPSEKPTMTDSKGVQAEPASSEPLGPGEFQKAEKRAGEKPAESATLFKESGSSTDASLTPESSAKASGCQCSTQKEMPSLWFALVLLLLFAYRSTVVHLKR